MYKTSSTYSELSPDQKNKDWKSIDDVVSKVLNKEEKKFRVDGDIEDKKCKIYLKWIAFWYDNNGVGRVLIKS